MNPRRRSTPWLLLQLACTAYLPLFFFHVVWFLPYALLPRGVLSEIVMRRLEPWL
jgi:hypothetical protein